MLDGNYVHYLLGILKNQSVVPKTKTKNISITL